MKTFFQEKKALAWAGCRKGNSTFYISCDNKMEEADHPRPSGASAERHSFLQYAMLHFRDSHIPSGRESVSTKFMTWRKNRHASEWTWKELTDKVKYSPFPIVSSLLKLESDYLNRLAVDSFKAIMRYMGDLPMGLHQREVECVYTILVMSHHHPALRDETVCQLMKQTTNNKSLNPFLGNLMMVKPFLEDPMKCLDNTDSKIRGWRLLSFLLSFFKCSDSLMPYLNKYLKSAAQDCRRIEKDTAKVCLLNLHQTITYGGRRNVPTESEVCAVTAGQLNKEQNYFLPGGVQVVLSTSSSTVVGDVVKSICQVMGIAEESKIMEFSLYCIVEGDEYTLPLERDEYVLDLTAELQRNGHHYYLVFCRSLWYHDLRLDSELYIEIVFQQILPDYLEGYLVILPHHLTPENWEQINRIAYLLHRAHGMDIAPTERDLKHLVPKPALSRKRPELDRGFWDQVTALTATEAKAQFLEILQKWALFGSCFFAVKMLEDNFEKEYIVAVNKSGINILHFESHEILWRFSFQAARLLPSSTTDEAEIELGDSHFKKVIRLQVDHANEISRLIKQYVSVQEPSDFSCPKVMIKV